VSVVGTVLAVVLVGGGAAVSPALDVDQIVVEGVRRTPEAEVTAATGLRRGAAMATLDAGDAADGVEDLPWVERATVERRWPGTVAVEVVERAPAAALAAPDGRWVLVDDDGHRLARVRTPERTLVTVEGLGEAAGGPLGDRVPRPARGAVELAHLLPATVRYRLPRIGVLSGGALLCKVRSVDGEDALARLGPPERLREKVIALATILESSDLRGVERIDLRVPVAPVLTRR